MANAQTHNGMHSRALSQANSTRWLRYGGAAILAFVLLGGAYALLLAQVGGQRGIAPTASSSDIEITGIKVDVTADSGAEARSKAWREAQRKAWDKAGGPAIAAGQLESMVSAIVIQRERLGGKRYIATLGVVFDRQRAGRFLGGAARKRASAPMLLMPVMVSGGAYTTFEVRNPWQRAWAEFNPGMSRIDYVRPSGAGGDSLLLNFGKTKRRSRAWWNSVLDQQGAADVLSPIVRLEHQFPGGPVTGHFVARYGPDNTLLGKFKLTADSPNELPDMLNTAVERMDGIFSEALEDGKLRPDPTIRYGGAAAADPAVIRLIQIGRQIQAQEAAKRRGESPRPTAPSAQTAETPVATPTPVTVSNIAIQFTTPDAASFDAALGGVRGAPGVRGVAVTSTAMGGTSVMSVTYAGSISELAAALRSRGFNVSQGGNTLAISR